MAEAVYGQSHALESLFSFVYTTLAGMALTAAQQAMIALPEMLQHKSVAAIENTADDIGLDSGILGKLLAIAHERHVIV